MYNVPKRKISKNQKNLEDTLLSFFRCLLDYIICVYIVLILAVLPFYFSDGYGYIGTDKAVLFSKITRSLGLLLLPLAAFYGIVTLIKHIRNRKNLSCTNTDTNSTQTVSDRLLSFWKKLQSSFSATDFFAAGYGLAVILSYLCSPYKTYALWGAEHWYMGFFTQIALVVSYFLISRAWKARKFLFYLIFPVSSAVFLLGYLNRFEIYPIKMEYASPSFISTIGNLNWYCGYVVSVLFGGIALLWQGSTKKNWQKVLLAGYAVLGLGTLVTQGSDSGIAALIVVLITLFWLSTSSPERMDGFWKIMLAFCGSCLFTYFIRKAGLAELNYQSDPMLLLLQEWVLFPMMIISVFFFLWGKFHQRQGVFRQRLYRVLAVFLTGGILMGLAVVLILAAVNTLHPGSLGPLSDHPMFSFSDGWGSRRGATWRAGWMCFAELGPLHKLTGAGPDAMWPFIVKDGSQELYSMVVNNFGENISLANAHNEWLTVLVDTGILGLAGFAGLMITSIRRFLRRAGKKPLVCACGLCLLAYTINNIFSFQQALSASTIFVILGMGRAFDRHADS